MRTPDPSVDLLWPAANAFEGTLLGLEYPESPAAVDTFTGACVEMFRTRDPDSYDYSLSQVFEPDVLTEVALLRGVDPDDTATLRYAPTATVRGLRDAVAGARDLSGAQAVNLAAALVSVSRFALAGQVLDAAEPQCRTPRDRFEIAMLRFITTNRSADGQESRRYFAEMRRGIEDGDIPDGRVLDACTQAVVWYLKRREVPEDGFAWFVRRGSELVQRGERDLPQGAVSSWYRGAAMLPARSGNTAKTRMLMERAKEAAYSIVGRSDRAYDKHFVKTYYESSMKECMYVRPDPDGAEDFGLRLIDLDRLWGPSWSELAEAYAHFGRLAEACHAFDNAVRLGSPWVRYSLRSAGDLYDKLGDTDRSFARYYALTLFDDVTPDVIEVGARLAAVARPDMVRGFDELRRQSPDDPQRKVDLP